MKKTWQAGESNKPELLMGVQKSHGEKPLFAADRRRVLYATATSEARDFLVWFVSFLSLEFIFNIHSNKTSLAIAYSVFQELSTAHRDNRPIQEFYTIMRTIGSSSPPWGRSYVIHILPVAVPRSCRGPEISNVYFSSSCTFA